MIDSTRRLSGIKPETTAKLREAVMAAVADSLADYRPTSSEDATHTAKLIVRKVMGLAIEALQSREAWMCGDAAEPRA